MNKQALKDWIETELPGIPTTDVVYNTPGAQAYSKRIVKAVWRAATKHTLHHVAAHLQKLAELGVQRQFHSETAEWIRRMEP